tara:strand:- start:142 stop:1434 length:1293 start_codon:yes stop_codon:yes gene_type:complete
MATEKQIIIPYSPRKPQQQIHDALDSFRYSVIIMHRRGGKSMAGINHMIKYAFTHTMPNIRMAYVAPTFRQAKSIAWDYIKQFTKEIPGIKYNETELRCDFPNGARITLYGIDANPDALRGNYYDLVVMDEVQLIDPDVFPKVILPALSDRKGKCLFIGTPLSTRNYLYDLYKKANADPAWYCKVFKASETGIIDKFELDQLKKNMTEEEYRQEFECDFSASISGTIYGKIIDKLDADGNITNISYDPGYPVHTAWDIGYSDSTCILFFQEIGRQIYVIDSLVQSGEGLPYFVKEVKNRDYVYGEHYAPHDIEQHDFSNGMTRREVAYQLGIRFKVASKLSVEEGIHMTSMLLSRSFFDQKQCEIVIDALRHYHRKWNVNNKLFSKPVHDWSSHICDALRVAAVSLTEGTKGKQAPQQKAENSYQVFGVN